jgi:hypothetical protein
MTNAEIVSEFDEVVRDERLITNRLLTLINKIDERKIFLELGYSSLFDWLVRRYGYSESSAYRRIEAARLIRAVPEVKEKMESGTLNLTNAAKVRSAIRAKEKSTGKKVSAQEQAEAVAAVEKKTSVEADSALCSLFPEIKSSVHQERMTVLDENTRRALVNLSEEDIANLEWARDFLSHAMPNASNGQVLSRVLKEFRKRNEKWSYPSFRATLPGCIVF